MKKLILVAVLSVFSLLSIGCAHNAPVVGTEPARPRFSGLSLTGFLGGKDVQIFNSVRPGVMDCQVAGPKFPGDVYHNRNEKGELLKVPAGDAIRFFFAHQSLRDRREATVVCTFTTIEDKELVYLGLKEVRVSISNRGGQFDSEVEQIRHYDQPTRERIRD